MNYINFSKLNIKVNGEQLYCKSAVLNTQMSVNAVFETESKTPKYFSPTSLPKGAVNFNYYLTGKDPLYDHIFNETKPIEIDFAGVLINSGFLSSYSWKAQPYQPVMIDVSVDFFEKLEGQVEKADEAILPKKALTFKGLKVNNSESMSEEHFVEASYSYSTQISPSFEIQENVDLAKIPLKRISIGNKTVKGGFVTYDYGFEVDLSLSDHKVEVNFGGEQYYVLSGPIISESHNVDAGSNIIRNFQVSQGVIDSSPKITSISSTAGPAGTTVVVNGENLGHPIAVHLFDYICDFTSVDSNTVHVKIPPEPYIGYEAPIKISTWGGEVISEDSFEVTYVTPTATQTPYATHTLTKTMSYTPSRTMSYTSTTSFTPTQTKTYTPSQTSSYTSTYTQTSYSTYTSTYTPFITATATATPTRTPTATQTPISTPTFE